jgi:HEAT repeat protein
VRQRVAFALAKLGASGVESLMTMLKDEHAYKVDAIDGLGKVNDGNVIEPLVAALKISNGDERWHIIINLAHVASHLDDSAIRTRVKEVFTTALNDIDKRVREEAGKQLMKLS